MTGPSHPAPAPAPALTVPTGSALAFERVTKTYRVGTVEVHALNGCDLTIEAGTVTAVTGASGSGKSTLLHLAAGMIGPTAGTVRVAGQDLAGRSVAQLAALRRRSVGVVFQQFNLLPTLTAVENVTLPLEMDGMAMRDARQRAVDALRQVGIDGPLDRYPDDLSGGQQQRVAIARAIVVPRAVVLADEPTGALDTLTGDRIMERFCDLAAAGAAVVVVTHEPRVAAFADRVVTLRDGKRVADTGAAIDRHPVAGPAGVATGVGVP